MFYADQVLSLLTPPPFQFASGLHIKKCDPRNLENFFSFYVQFSFVRNSVHTIYA